MKINANAINTEVLSHVVAAAKAAVNASNRTDSARWISAIDRAVEELASNPYITFEDGKLIVLSNTSNQIYEVAADGTHAGCKAAEAHQPCRHRALRRLLDLYAQAVALPHIPRTDLEPTTRAAAARTPATTAAAPRPSRIPAGALISPSLTMKAERYNGIEI